VWSVETLTSIIARFLLRGNYLASKIYTRETVVL
jgi:hypothetical protein